MFGEIIAVVPDRAVESVHKISDSDSFIKAQCVLYNNGKPTNVINGIIRHFMVTI
jgi:hypothetical protein